METNPINSNNSTSGRPLTGVWKHFKRGVSKGDGALKLLNLGYKVPSHEVLFGYLLDVKEAKVINKVDRILEYTTNPTI
ncbi:19341_t:CDS:2, partial [Gigaspora margarita]